ncbi:hypothetical protein TOPH_01845 [Tolypocladium ophioglossoides CBS 100239]|uniref:Uncharacterized protein n=1 Tax=Tolypocladium ophioglossoides (strain CBS 100239) TaxID=1163406 RepID=A0A0L0NJK3_TOLOC|nr:hypothetical protein TOPH_01845 [Tolypocladium ophioglossoides CBS 100239]
MWRKAQKPSTLPPITVAGGGSTSTRDTCGWISGDPSCCWSAKGNPCHISTRCLDKSPYSDLQEAAENLDLICYGDVTPYCKTDVFAGDAKLNGFSLFICDTDRVTETVLRYTTITTGGERTRPSRPSSSAPTNTRPASTSQVSSPTPPPSFSPPALSVAGTVLGSIGALSLLIASLWLYRKWRKGLKLTMRKEVKEAPRSARTQPVRVGMPSQRGTQTGTQTGPDHRSNTADEGV